MVPCWTEVFVVNVEEAEILTFLSTEHCSYRKFQRLFLILCAI